MQRERLFRSCSEAVPGAASLPKRLPSSEAMAVPMAVPMVFLSQHPLGSPSVRGHGPDVTGDRLVPAVLRESRAIDRLRRALADGDPLLADAVIACGPAALKTVADKSPAVSCVHVLDHRAGA